MFEFLKKWFFGNSQLKTQLNQGYESFEEVVEALYNLSEHGDCVVSGNGMNDFFVGMNLRNKFNLWNQDSPLVKHFVKRFGLIHADDISMIIGNAVKARKEKKEYNPWEDVERCKRHWENYGYNPATMERIK